MWRCFAVQQRGKMCIECAYISSVVNKFDDSINKFDDSVVAPILSTKFSYE